MTLNDVFMAVQPYRELHTLLLVYAQILLGTIPIFALGQSL